MLKVHVGRDDADSETLAEPWRDRDGELKVATLMVSKMVVALRGLFTTMAKKFLLLLDGHLEH